MKEKEIARMLRQHFEGLFPKSCPKCSRHFATLWEYVRGTQEVWPVVSYDAESNDYEPIDPIGIFAMANCSCRTTIALSTERMPLSETLHILGWIRAEMRRTGLNPTALLNRVRDKIRRQLLVESIREVA
jgi:hypothetical protein